MTSARIRNLPTLADMAATRRAVPKYEIAAKVSERATSKRTREKDLAAAKAKVWARAKGKCERCGATVVKGVDSLTAGQVHHKQFRSKGGKDHPDNLELLCARKCHPLAHHLKVK